MKILKEIDKLEQTGIIDSAVAARIREYYQSRIPSGSSTLLNIFSILGAVLVGLGIILVLAHNWDILSKTVRTVIAFLPLLLAQGVCIYVFRNKLEQFSWREAASTFLFFTIGTSIFLVAQIYHIYSPTEDLLLLWMMLVAPVIYLMRSSFISLLFIGGITWLGLLGNNGGQESYWFWLLLLFVLPKYIMLWPTETQKNIRFFHHAFIIFAILSNLWTLHGGGGTATFFIYLAVLSIFYQLGDYFNGGNGTKLYQITGSLGIAFILLIWSFEFLWEEKFSTPQIFWFSMALAVVNLFVLFVRARRNSRLLLDLTHWAFFILAAAIAIAHFQPDVSWIIINAFIFIFAIGKMSQGIKENSLLVLNYGLLLMATLIVCRFFDTDISFVLKGILFIAIGLAFFAVNYFMLKKRREA